MRTCPKCQSDFVPFLRGQIYRSLSWAILRGDFSWFVARWRGEYWPSSALICWACKEIVGYE